MRNLISMLVLVVAADRVEDTRAALAAAGERDAAVIGEIAAGAEPRVRYTGAAS